MQYKGLTLIELMIVMCILGMLMCFSVPLYQRHHAQVALSSIEHELSTLLMMARLQAFLQGRTLILAPIALSKTGEWQRGIRLFSLQDGDTLYRWEWSHQMGKVEWFGFRSHQYISIDPFPEKLAMNGYFRFDDGAHAYKIIVNRFGRLSRAPISA